MFENDVYKAYLVYKGINLIIFGENYSSNFDLVTSIFNLDTYKSLCMLDTIVTNYRSILDEKMKDNIYKLVNYYRYDVKTFSEEEREKSFDICNNIIKFVNQSDKKDKYKFIALELRSRGFCAESIFNYVKKDNVDLKFNEVKLYNVADFYIICTLSDLFPIDEYEKYKESLSNPNFPTMYCITGIINEFPEILNAEIFRKNVKNITSLMKESFNSSEQDKTVKKEYKKYEKLIRKVCI